MALPLDHFEQNTPNHRQDAPMYAGFWLRFAAALIDGLIVGVIAIMLGFMLALAMNPRNERAFEQVAVVLSWLFVVFGSLFYHAWMESSSNQGSLGKMAVGLKVTDMYGERISFPLALGRYLCKFLSSLVMCVGYIIAAFTEKKQALHDIIVGTLVVLKSSAPASYAPRRTEPRYSPTPQQHSQDIAARLTKLEDLRRRELITESEYQEKKNEILRDI